jgi:hypothetical protein
MTDWSKHAFRAEGAFEARYANLSGRVHESVGLSDRSTHNYPQDNFPRHRILRGWKSLTGSNPVDPAFEMPPLRMAPLEFSGADSGPNNWPISQGQHSEVT